MSVFRGSVHFGLGFVLYKTLRADVYSIEIASEIVFSNAS